MYLDRKTLRRMAGETIMCGFAGRNVDAALLSLCREVAPLGLVLFERNLVDAEQAHALNAEIKSARPGTLMAIDQEGGRVMRLREGVTVFGPMAHLGRADDTSLAAQIGHAIGTELAAVGFDLNFAPVLDVDTNADNPIIGDRAFAHSAEAVARLGVAFATGLQGAGVAACAKHFPGHGDTTQDSHVALPVIHHGRTRLEATEWPPFAEAARARVASVMTAHVQLTAFDEAVPATLSKTLLTDILRGQLGFAGAIIADDIDMKGLSLQTPAGRVGAQALLAGCDVLLACHDPDSTVALYAGIVRAAESGTLPHRVLAERAARAATLRQTWHKSAARWADAKAHLKRHQDAHRALAERMRVG